MEMDTCRKSGIEEISNYAVRLQDKGDKEARENIDKLMIFYVSLGCKFATKDEIIPLLKSLETASGGVGDWRYLVLDSIDHWWIKYIRFQRLSNGQYFCFTDSADTIIPLYKDKLKAEFVNQNENHRVHRT
jgi:hypothetical protein